MNIRESLAKEAIQAFRDKVLNPCLSRYGAITDFSFAGRILCFTFLPAGMEDISVSVV